MVLNSKKGRRYFVALTVLALVAFTHSVFAIKSESQMCGEQVNNKFDKTLSEKVSSYAIGAWIRLSMSVPCQPPTENFFQKTTLIMGLSNSKDGWMEKLDRYDHFIALIMTPMDNNQQFILRFDSNQQIKTVALKLASPFLGDWIYVQLVYNAQKQLIISSIWRQGEKDWFKSVDQAENRNDSTNLNFSLGKKESGYYAQFNGDIESVEFISDPKHQLLDNKISFENLNLPTPKAYGIPNGYNTSFFVGYVQDTVKITCLSAPGTRAYSINLLLSFKTKLDPKKNYSILRIGNLDNQNTPLEHLDIQKEFCLNYIQGFFQIVTYSLVNGRGTPLKIEIQFQKVKFFENEELNISFAYFPNIKEYWVRMKSFRDQLFETYQIKSILKADIGQFNFYANESGEKIKFNINSNFYSEKGTEWINYEKNKKSTSIYDFYDRDTENIDKTYMLPAFYLFKHSANEFSYFGATGNRVTGSSRILMMHFWFRRDINEAEFSDLNSIRSNDQIIASLTQSSSTDKSVEKVEFLGIYYRSHLNQKNPNYIIKTVNQKNAKKVEQNLVVDFTNQQAQNEWHLFFVSLSYERKEIFITVSLNGLISSSLQKEFVLNDKYDVTASMGVSKFSQTKQKMTPGEFYNPQLLMKNSDKLTFINNLDLFKKYSAIYCLNPKIRVGKTMDIPFTNLSLPFQTISPSLFKYSKTYSVSIWARLNAIQGEPISRNTIFQLSINKVRTKDTQPRLGDNALHVFVNQNNVVFSTYSMGFLPEQDMPELQKVIPYNFSTGQWCFFYFGYNSITQSANGFINCDDGFVQKVVFESVNHISPTEGYLQLGNSYQYNQLAGEIHYPVLSANTAIKVDAEIPKNLLEFKPQTPTCATFYSDCNFKTLLASACEDLPVIDLSKIKSIFLPSKTTVQIFNQANFNGLNIKVKKSVECFQSSLYGAKDLKWEALSAFFNEGVLTFTNESGDEIPIEDAKVIFFGSNESDSSTPSLRRNISRKSQDSISDNDLSSTSVF